MSLYRVRIEFSKSDGGDVGFLKGGKLVKSDVATFYDSPSSALRAFEAYHRKQRCARAALQKCVRKIWYEYKALWPKIEERNHSRMHRPGQPDAPVHSHTLGTSVLDSVVLSTLKNKGLSPQSAGIGVPEILEAMAKTFRERNAVYGDNWKLVGEVMGVLFPKGVRLTHKALAFIDGHKSTPPIVHYDVWHLFELQVVKLTRFAISGLTHIDSVHDMSVYGAMIEGILKQREKANAAT